MTLTIDHTPQFKQHLVDSPVYKGGNPIQLIRDKYGIEDIVKLASNENPRPTNPKVLAALETAVHTLNRYPSNSDEALRHQLADYIQRGVTKEQIFTGNGGCDVLQLIAHGFLEVGDEAIICPPTFPIYEITIKKAGGVPIYANRKPNFDYDIEAILTAVTPRTRLIYLCSPNNPTGNILYQHQLETLLAQLPRDIVIVADEVYWQFNSDHDMADSIEKINQSHPLIIVHSFSKVFGLAGLRLGYGITTPEIANYLSRGRLPFHINHLTLTAAAVALKDTDYICDVAEETIREREFVFNALHQMEKVAVFPSEANFLLIKPERDVSELAEALMSEGVIIRDLARFYMPGYGRVSIGLPEENRRFLSVLSRHL